VCLSADRSPELQIGQNPDLAAGEMDGPGLSRARASRPIARHRPGVIGAPPPGARYLPTAQAPGPSTANIPPRSKLPPAPVSGSAQRRQTQDSISIICFTLYWNCISKSSAGGPRPSDRCGARAGRQESGHRPQMDSEISHAQVASRPSWSGWGRKTSSAIAGTSSAVSMPGASTLVPGGASGTG
jgi:hypothetical protein